MPQVRRTFPFSAIVGQALLKQALLLAAVDPRCGGVLIRGARGTAKSTAVRALAAVLPPIPVVAGCPYGCAPDAPAGLCERCTAASADTMIRRPHLVDLPVSASEDRVVGTLDFEHALRHGERRFEPGLLARAHRGILYVDEVNLLDDHLVDVLLDVAASGVNVVEREGVTVAHPARFLLIGTMNPEEGELRPQLLDRFGLCADVTGIATATDRMEIVRRRQRFEDEPEAFSAEWSAKDAELGSRIEAARKGLLGVTLPDAVLHEIARLTATLEVEGHRADLVIARAAMALAALNGGSIVTSEHVAEVSPLVLAHRLSTDSLAGQMMSQGVRASFGTALIAPSVVDAATSPHAESSATGAPPLGESAKDLLAPVGGTAEMESAPASVERLHSDRVRRGRRLEAPAHDRTGRHVRARPHRPGEEPDIALDATLRAAAPRQAWREGELAVRLEPEDLQRKVRTHRAGVTVCLCVDASGSMGAARRMEAAKGAVMALLADAYVRRDRVALVSFRGTQAETVLEPTDSVERARRALAQLPVGGATPLASGIARAVEVLRAERVRDASMVPWLVLVTDGRANVGLGTGLATDDARRAAERVRSARIRALVVDPGGGEHAPARQLARAAHAEYVSLAQVEGDALAHAVRAHLDA